MHVRRSALASLVVLASILVVALGCAGWSLLHGTAIFDATRFSFVRWEATTLFNKWIYEVGAPFRDDPSDDEALRRYFAASAELQALRAVSGDDTAAERSDEIARLEDERRRLENHVEAIIEGRITAVAGEAGLKRELPLLPDIVWPPVDFELTSAPQVLAISTRDRIELIGDDVLNPALDAEERAALERRATDDEQVATVLRTSGVAAYPSIVDADAPYAEMVEIAAHEWLHHYLAFYPLGWNYFDADLRSVNETVVSIAAHDLAQLVIDRHPPPALPGGTSEMPARRAQVDVRRELTDLRERVDDLLDLGRVEEAEALMEATRIELERKGVGIRRINQAYFAFRGLYATSGVSGDDLGERLLMLREREGSVGAFLGAVRGVSSRAELERILVPD